MFRSSAARTFTSRCWIDASRKSIAATGFSPVSASTFGVTCGSSCAEARRRAAPDDLHGAVARLELPDRELERAVLHDEPAGEHGCEHGRAGDDPERDEREPFAACAEPGADEAQRERDPAQHHQR